MRPLPAAALLLVVLARPALAKLEGAEWTQAEQNFKRLFGNPGDVELKTKAIRLIASDGEPRAWQLLAQGAISTSTQLARSGEHYAKVLASLQELLGKKLSAMYQAERDEMYSLQGEASELEALKLSEEAVLTVLVREFGDANEEARKQILAQARAHREWTVRAFAARVAATAPNEALSKQTLAEALAAKEDPRVKTTALAALARASGTSWQDLVIARIEDSDWGVSLVAARIAGDRELGKAIPVLIKVLASATPRVAEEIVIALRALTGQSIEPYADVWAKWWEANRAKWGEDGRPLQPLVQKPRQSDIDFYGLKIKSNKVLFIIDISGSMKEPMPPPIAPKGPVTGDKPPPPVREGTKIDIAKQELTRALKKLPKEAMFGIIAFNQSVLQWQPKMLPATDDNKEIAYTWIREFNASGATYVDGALRLAFKIAGMGAYDKAYPGVGVDTIILLTDGAPTDNADPTAALMDPAEILGHVREWNSQKRVIIHCVGIDRVQGIDFLKKLAKENGGTYVDG